MRVQNNLQAVNSHRVLGLNNLAKGKSVEKLSSGLRINKAGDDAAGLAISEKMRSQIRGLNRASRNSQDAISLVQTAEGATNEVHEMLQRMREISVQAANDTNTSTDREALQEEMSQLSTEVDRIANTTEFNTVKLLDGSASPSVIPQATVDALTAALPAYIDDAMDAIESYMSLDTPAGLRDMDITYYYDASSTTGASMGTSDAGASLTFRVNLAGVTDASGSLVASEIIDTLVAHEVMHAYEFTNMATATSGNASEGWFVEGLAMAIQGGSLFAVTDHDVAAGGFDGDYRSAYEAVKVMHELVDGGINALIDQLETGLSLDAAINAVTWTADADLGGLDVAAGHTVADIVDTESFRTFFNDSTDVDTFLARTAGTQEFDPSVSGAITTGGTKGSTSALSLAATIINDAATATADASFNINFTNAGFGAGSGGLVIQIGSNIGQTMELQLGDVTASSLGVDSIDVSTRFGAQTAITTLDGAIQNVSSIRSILGATQNRLEHTIKNLDNSAENLQSSESRIRDVDMANEMMNFTKTNILSQAAQSMLSQANQAPQGVLQLLR